MCETEQIDRYLFKRLAPNDMLLMEANALINNDLKEKIVYQKQTHALIREFSRKKLRAEIEAVHFAMFSEKKFESFRQKITSIFKTQL